jgi:hypothetical protein
MIAAACVGYGYKWYDIQFATGLLSAGMVVIGKRRTEALRLDYQRATLDAIASKPPPTHVERPDEHGLQ